MKVFLPKQIGVQGPQGESERFNSRLVGTRCQREDPSAGEDELGSIYCMTFDH